jgi:hypothetical protein
VAKPRGRVRGPARRRRHVQVQRPRSRSCRNPRSPTGRRSKSHLPSPRYLAEAVEAEARPPARDLSAELAPRGRPPGARKGDTDVLRTSMAKASLRKRDYVTGGRRRPARSNESLTTPFQGMKRGDIPRPSRSMGAGEPASP